MAVTSAELSAMRAEALRYMPDTVVQQRGTVTSDGQGGSTQAFNALGTVVGRRTPIAGSERLIAGRMSAESEVVITLPHDATVKPRDQLVFGSDTYEVTAVHEPKTWEIQTVCEAKQLDVGG